MPILYKFSGLDHLALAVPVEGGRCSLCCLYGGMGGCTKDREEVDCSVIMEEEDGTDFYVFKELVGR